MWNDGSSALTHAIRGMWRQPGPALTVVLVLGVALGLNATLFLMVTGNFFDVLGIRPALGRGLTAAEDRLRDPRAVVVLGYRLWERGFAKDPSVLGTVLHLNGSPFTVVGVAPREFADSEPGYDTQLFLPVSALPLIRPDDASVETILNDPKSCCANLVGRLRPGVDTDQARAELAIRTRGLRLSRLFRHMAPWSRTQPSWHGRAAPTRLRRY